MDSMCEVARTQLLTETKLPTLSEVYSRLQRGCKDSRKDISRGSVLGVSIALVSSNSITESTQDNRSSTQGGRGGGRDGGRDGPHTCFHCGEMGHLKKYCLKLHGKTLQFQKVANVAIQKGFLPTPNRSRVTSEKPPVTVSIPVDEYIHHSFMLLNSPLIPPVLLFLNSRVLPPLLFLFRQVIPQLAFPPLLVAGSLTQVPLIT